MRQLPLDLALPPRYGRDDYLASPANAAALEAIDCWPDWPDRVLLLLGPAAAGKSHLGAIWAERAQARVVRLPAPRGLAEVEAHPSGAILIDDADRLGDEEKALFHLLNLVRETGGSLLLTAQKAPDLWGLRTADLVSRLRLAPVARVGAPDDDLLRAVLVKLFADRQLLVDEAVIGYLVLRLDRSIAAARAAVEALDATGLAMNRRITRSMAAQLLGAADEDEGPVTRPS